MSTTKKSISNEAKVMFLSFIYFALVMEKNGGDVGEKMRRLFYKLSRITKLYENYLQDVLNEANNILKDYEADIDYLLASVSIIAFYYEAMKGKKRKFEPMSHKEILLLQDELLEADDRLANSTFDFCELIVNKMLKD